MKKYIFLILFFLFSIYFGLFFGTKIYTIREIFNLSEIEKTIFLKIRIPRVLCAFIVGGGLSISGAVLQSILKNPLAESYTLGISGGASLGVTIGVIIGKVYSIPLFSFIGSLFSLFIILSISIIKKLSITSIILAGISLNFIFSSLVLFLISISSHEKIYSTLFFLFGDLSSFSEKILFYSGILIFICFIFLTLSGRIYDILSIDEEKAKSLGVNVNFEKNLTYFITCLISSLCVCLSGIIGFVGLIIPHIVRSLFTSIHKKVIPISFIFGGSFLIICDTISRIIIRPVEIPVGVITGFFGGIFFLTLLLKAERIW
ncbi:MAG: iron ABC transporter permease [Candidatus Omnitrophica bacterium]|nr:iron ABC transporter permease [Candidatus Omnitrophota bacterium]MCM8802349.1 iron ABC transporter permease [Candidatus Omnitrophota bacterium]